MRGGVVALVVLAIVGFVLFKEQILALGDNAPSGDVDAGGLGQVGDTIKETVPQTADEAAGVVDEHVASPVKQYGSLVAGGIVAGVVWYVVKVLPPRVKIILALVAGAVAWAAISG